MVRAAQVIMVFIENENWAAQTVNWATSKYMFRKRDDIIIVSSSSVEPDK